MAGNTVTPTSHSGGLNFIYNRARHYCLSGTSRFFEGASERREFYLPDRKTDLIKTSNCTEISARMVLI